MQNYPQYRKYVGIDTWFKITSETHFIEVKKIGHQKMITEVNALQFPEKVFIQDMINCLDNRWEKISADTFEQLMD